MGSRVTQVSAIAPTDAGVLYLGGTARATQVAKFAPTDAGVLYLGGTARITQVARVIIGALPAAPPAPPPPVTPGSAKVWPPAWQEQNEYDRCLNRFRLRARNVCLQAESRCIVWHDMDELGRMPDGAVEFYERGSIVTPAPAATPTTVMQFVVPTGYLGIIYGVLLHYTGTGFVEGSGDIVWRVMIGNAWAAPGLGNCLFQLGTVGQCLSLTDYLPANSNQRISVSVQVPNTSGNIQVGASRILATLQGWYYPI